MLLYVLRVQTRSALTRQIDKNGCPPGKRLQFPEGLGPFSGFSSGQLFESEDGSIGMVLEKSAELRSFFARQSSGKVERMFSADYHEGKHVPQTDDLEPYFHSQLFHQVVFLHVEPDHLFSPPFASLHLPGLLGRSTTGRIGKKGVSGLAVKRSEILMLMAVSEGD